jgi:hypothetical protein
MASSHHSKQPELLALVACLVSSHQEECQALALHLVLMVVSLTTRGICSSSSMGWHQLPSSSSGQA